MLDRVPHQVDPATFPAITVGQDVSDFDHTMVGPGAQEVVQTLAENLELENQALLRATPTLLTAVDHGDRLDEMQARLADAISIGHDHDQPLPTSTPSTCRCSCRSASRRPQHRPRRRRAR